MTAIYPGSFDPVTFGHLDIIERVSGLVDRLIVAVLNNPSKNRLLTPEESVCLLKSITSKYPNVEVRSFSGLLVDFLKENDAKLVIRGLRAVTDFEYEFQMSLTNRELFSGMETLLIPASLQYLYLSSSVAKEVFLLGGDVSTMLPSQTIEMLNSKLK